MPISWSARCSTASSAGARSTACAPLREPAAAARLQAGLGHGNERQEWYDCACCPPNIMRLLSSLHHYLATHDNDGVQIQQYAPCNINAHVAGGAIHLQSRQTTRGKGRCYCRSRRRPPRRGGCHSAFRPGAPSPCWSSMTRRSRQRRCAGLSVHRAAVERVRLR